MDVIVAGLARAKEIDIKAAYDALKNAKHFRIHTFIRYFGYSYTGKIWRCNVYGKTLEEKRKTVLKMANDAVAYAKTFTEDVEFSAEDAGRTDIGYLI